MNKTIDFLKAFTHAEGQAWDAYMRPDLEAYHIALDALNTHLSPALQNRIGLIPQSSLLQERIYEAYRLAPPPPRRLLFRVDLFQGSDGENYHVAFCSKFGGAGKQQYFHAFLVAVTEAGPVLTRRYQLDEDEAGWFWKNAGGDESIDFRIATTPTVTIRLQDPVDHTPSLSIHTMSGFLARIP